MKIRSILLLILSITALAACGTKIGELKLEDSIVFDYIDRSSGFRGLVINVNTGESKLEISKSGIKKCVNNIRGCLKIKRGKRANIGFKLHDDDSAEWSFKEFSICKGDTKSTGPCKLIRAERRDFDARALKDSDEYFAPDKAGIIDLTQLSPNLTQFVLHIENSIRQDYFYNIEACRNDGTKCVSLDPVMRNRGR